MTVRKLWSRPKACPTLASILALPTLLAWANLPQTRPNLDQQLTATVKPFLLTYCANCHGKQKPQAQLDLTSYATVASVARDYPHWSLVMERLEAKQMPPTGAKQPSATQRAQVIAWIRAVRQAEMLRTAGDPGPVLARRLSNAEYDYTIRDLTGVDLRPTREFPVDPANQEGFDNSGESLTLSPALLKKYVQAAKTIADNVVLTSSGLEFASHPVLVETDRDKFCILRIVDFYKKQPTDLADYFEAAWRYRHRAALGRPDRTLQTVAVNAKVSSKYLEKIWATLTSTEHNVGPVAKLKSMWNELQPPNTGSSEPSRIKCVAMRDWVLAMRKKVAWKFANLQVPRGFSEGGQCFVLWKDREYASHRRMLDPGNLQIGGVPPSRVVTTKRNRNYSVADRTITDPTDADLAVPTDSSEREAYLKSFEQFCRVFPDAFYIAERGRMFVDDPGDKGRLLTAGLHNSMGYFRDDTPLMELILDDKGRKDLDRLWLDFDTVAFIPERMHLEFFFYERAEAHTTTDPEFNFARPEDKGALSDAKIKLLGDLYLAKAKRNGGEPIVLAAIEDHFKRVSVNIRGAERARLAAEPLHLKSLIQFASKAFRRPLTDPERTGILSFYQSLRQKDGLTHEDAIRDSIITIFMSPSFLFRMDFDSPEQTTSRRSSLRTATLVQQPKTTPNLQSIQPLSDYALASRLSYFLWSSMPDDELLGHAAAGDLHQPQVLASQTKRMLRHPRARALALEFVGNWLDFRRFEEHNAVDRDRFPGFNDGLRESMFEEPLHFLMDGFQHDGSILDMLYAKHTFVNAALARHYGMSDLNVPSNEWKRIDNADRYGRGGLLTMAVFLTKNSPGLRTSPVKRGYWVVKRLLGEAIPPPPAVVPELPKDESRLGDLTLRQALAKHRENPACAGCHARFDSYGLVFEGYGPIGELRTKDLGGRQVDTKAPFPGGVERTGVSGLQDFIRKQRQKGFLDTFARKLLSYGLGRSLQLSDEPLLDEMQKRLAANDYRIGTLVESIVTSKQFRNRRMGGQ